MSEPSSASPDAATPPALTRPRRVGPPTPRVALLLVTGGIILAVLASGREALSPFVVGLLLVYLLDPPVEQLSRLRVPRWLAVLLVYVVAVVIVIETLGLMLTPLVAQLSDFIADLPRLSRAFDEQVRRISEIYRGLHLPPELRQVIDRAVVDMAARATRFDPAVLLPVFGSLAGFVSSMFGYMIVPVWVFYLLKDRPGLTQAFDRSLPPEWRADVWAVIRIVERVFAQWVRGQVVLGLSVGIATYIGLSVLSALVDPALGRFALLLAIVAGLFELLPIVGPILSAIPAVAIGLTVSPQALVAVFLLYFLIQQVENNFLVPKIQGDAVRLHPSAVMFALVLGGTIGGLLGAILALPITAAARDVYAHLFRRMSAPGAGPADASGLALAADDQAHPDPEATDA